MLFTPDNEFINSLSYYKIQNQENYILIEKTKKNFSYNKINDVIENENKVNHLNIK